MAIYTSISFPGHPPLSLKLRDDQAPLANLLSDLGSAGVREALNLQSFEELTRAAKARGETARQYLKAELTKQLRPVAAEAPYAGWPAKTLEKALEVIRQSGAKTFLDPFAGRADLAALAGQEGLRSWYCESSPVFAVVAEARLAALALAPVGRELVAEQLRRFNAEPRGAETGTVPQKLLRSIHRSHRSEVKEALRYLMRLRAAIEEVDSPFVAGLLTVAVIEALPRTTGELSIAPLRAAVREEIRNAAAFLRHERPLLDKPQFAAKDVADLELLRPLGIELVVTEPPSLNFAAYAVPAAVWFLGVSIDRRALPPADFTGAAVDAVGAKDRRMGRVVSRYFAAMESWVAAIDRHLSRRATVVLDISNSKVAGVKVATREEVGAMWKRRGFRIVSNEGMLLMRRGDG
ncbi:MAG TPA: hypothetical protein VF701_19135 [Thermoanaerobaculia bacterium]